MIDFKDLTKNREKLRPVTLYLGREVNAVGYQGKDIVYIPHAIKVPDIQLDKIYKENLTSYIYIVDREKLLDELKILKEYKQIDINTLNLIDELEEIVSMFVFISNQEIEFVGTRYSGIYYKIKLLKNVRYPKKYSL